MNTSTTIRTLLLDTVQGDIIPLITMLDFLIWDKGYSLERLERFGTRSLHLSEETCLGIMRFMEVEFFNQLFFIIQGRKYSLIKKMFSPLFSHRTNVRGTFKMKQHTKNILATLRQLKKQLEEASSIEVKSYNTTHSMYLGDIYSNRCSLCRLLILAMKRDLQND